MVGGKEGRARFGNEANKERMYARLLSFINRSLNLPETVAASAPAKRQLRRSLASIHIAGREIPLRLGTCQHAPKTPSPDPTGIAAFTRFSKYVNAKISPNGTYLGVVIHENGRRSLDFIEVKTGQISFGLTPDSGAMVSRFEWVSDELTIAEFVEEDPKSAVPVSYGGLYAATANGSFRQMIHDASFRRIRGRLLGRIRSTPETFLIATTAKASGTEGGDPKRIASRLNVFSGQLDAAVVSPIPQAQFIADENGEVRLALGEDERLERKAFYREPSGKWRLLTSLKGFSSEDDVMAISAADRTIYVASGTDGDGFGLFSVNIDTGQRTLLSKNDSPPSSLVQERHSGRVIAVEYEPDVPTYDFVAPNHPMCRLLRGLLAAYPGHHVRLVNQTDDDRKAVVHAYSDRDPGEFLIVDVEKMSADSLVAVRPWIDPEEMAATSSLHFTASDGIKIHGYITLPKGISGAPPPLLVVPHGGPHGVRDHWGFDEEAQLFASQGFAVLRVNYRGSGGYGRLYEESGYRHWGDRIIDDILEATRVVIKKGMVDSNRVCIYGASFGGYAALQSSIRAPELFRCAVGYAGVYDLTLMGKTDNLRFSPLGQSQIRRVLGEDSRALRGASPVYNADKIQASVFLIHGQNDGRSPIEHAERLRDALKKVGRPPEWLVERKEAHGFGNEENRERMYARLLSFINRSLNLPETVAGGAPSKPN